MALAHDRPILDLESLAQFEAAMTLEQRLPERSVLDVFIGAAARQPERTAITMLMSGAPDEQPRRVNYVQLLSMVRRSANLFASVGGPRPGVAYMLPSLVETHATLWGAETAGYAVPINFLLQVEHIAALLDASGARILVALGPGAARACAGPHADPRSATGHFGRRGRDRFSHRVGGPAR
jgi:fatty-acyl-CoA synthase